MQPEEARRRFAACREPLYERILSGAWTVDEYRRGQLAETVAPWGVLPEEVLSAHCALREAAVDGTSPVPGTHALLEQLRASGLAVGVLTNGTGALLQRKLAALGLEELVDAAISAVDLGTPKPAPAAYRTAAAALGLAPTALAMVGDHPEWDVAAALRAGYAAAVWLDRGIGVQAGELPPGAVRVRTLAEVTAALGLAAG
ncbi:MAG: HAD family hydrolase [Solirubrobacterales bacterium]|nr:HAD family hydrolase [Solirubrobacterales bacterium]